MPGGDEPPPRWGIIVNASMYQVPNGLNRQAMPLGKVFFFGGVRRPSSDFEWITSGGAHFSNSDHIRGHAKLRPDSEGTLFKLCATCWGTIYTRNGLQKVDENTLVCLFVRLMYEKKIPTTQKKLT